MEAVKTAIEVQDCLAQLSLDLPDGHQIPNRHQRRRRDDRRRKSLRDEVNIAARIEGLTKPGGVAVSAAVYDHRRPLGYNVASTSPPDISSWAFSDDAYAPRVKLLVWRQNWWSVTSLHARRRRTNLAFCRIRKLAAFLRRMSQRACWRLVSSIRHKWRESHMVWRRTVLSCSPSGRCLPWHALSEPPSFCSS